jgi:hypothetical protein
MGMKIKTIGLSLALCLATGALCFASPAMGTWKLNETKSAIEPGLAKNLTVVYAEAPGGMVKITIDGVDKNGKPTHTEWTGKFDGKDYPVTGDPNSDSRLYKQVDANKLEFIAKKGGKDVIGGVVQVAEDGKSRWVITSGTDADGKRFKTNAFYEKVEESKK